ncbi:MAG: Ni-sirohydrochlorin a,c-diamide reductive cyclase catalytic subunit, partial [Candidatus Methanospirareceae archaeon]
VGTCASMIIGEDFKVIKREIPSDDVVIIPVEVHCGFNDNTVGAIFALKAAEEAGIISKEELSRQERLLKRATEIEKERGMASMEYIKPSRGDNRMEVAHEIVDLIQDKKRVACVMIAKKELGYIFSDILAEINLVARRYGAEVVNIANLDASLGLPRIKKYSRNIINELSEKGVKIDYIVGGIDDYTFSGEKAAMIMEKEVDAEVAIVIGNAHAVEIKREEMMKVAITNGPREVIPLKRMGFDRVVVELDAHSKVVGTNYIVPSDFGDAIRYICKRGEK